MKKTAHVATAASSLDNSISPRRRRGKGGDARAQPAMRQGGPRARPMPLRYLKFEHNRKRCEYKGGRPTDERGKAFRNSSVRRHEGLPPWTADGEMRQEKNSTETKAPGDGNMRELPACMGVSARCWAPRGRCPGYRSLDDTIWGVVGKAGNIIPIHLKCARALDRGVISGGGTGWQLGKTTPIHHAEVRPTLVHRIQQQHNNPGGDADAVRTQTQSSCQAH
jgi:hypothetical protein